MIDLPFEEKIRLKRNQLWSDCAVAAKTNSKPARQICHDWSHSADQLLIEAFQHCFPQNKAALFALGKLGSSELNLSSDVDLLILCFELSPDLMSSLRNFQKILNDRTFLGFVFRVDFDLRPGGKQGPLLPTLDQFKDYYGNYGETWERLALVRLRALCGDQELLLETLKFAKKFSFRKHIDFSLLEDLKQLRTKIQSHYGSRTQEDVIDLKLGLGGIRDVELFTHAMQVIHGGRDLSLQVQETDLALELLGQKNLLPQKEVDFLIQHYWTLRALENYVQALSDEQTHLIRLKDLHPDFVVQSLANIKAQMKNCAEVVKELLGEEPVNVSLNKELKSEGFLDSEIQELWNEIVEQTVLSRNKDRDENSRKGFLIEFLNTLKAQKGNPRKGMLLLKDFIQSTRAKASFFSLLLREKKLQQELAWLFGHSPYLSRIICSRPELLDSFVYRSQNQLSSDVSVLLEELAEKRLLSEIINGSSFLRTMNLSALSENLTSTADEIVSALLQALKVEYPSQIQVLALGKWGGKELGLKSDLDFIFVVPDEPSENDFKLARRLISRLTENHRGGRIYDIDMRLRPSGKSGPLVMVLSHLQQYLKIEAAAWERQAYLKARWIGDYNGPALQKLFINQGLNASDLSELNRIRVQLLDSSVFNLKYNEGGLIDIELSVQANLLQEKQAPPSTATADFILQFSSPFPSVTDHLLKNYIRLRQIEQMLQLVASESTPKLIKNSESFQSLAVALHLTPEELAIELQTLLSENVELLKQLDPRRRSP